jgi:hypothetical protein
MDRRGLVLDFWQYCIDHQYHQQSRCTYFEAGNARSVNSSRDMGGTSYAYSNAGAATRTEEVDAVVIESVFSLVLERH